MTCGDGTQGRTQIVTTAASNGGDPCPTLQTDSQACNDGGCPGNVLNRLNDGPDPGDFRQGHNENTPR